MTRDDDDHTTSPPSNVPVTNGLPNSVSHGEVEQQPRSEHQHQHHYQHKSQSQDQRPTRQAQQTPQSSLRDVCADIHRRITAFLAADAQGDEALKRTQEQTRVAVAVVQRALKEYEFEQLSLSYNGGKDCLVLLLVYLSVLHTHFEEGSRIEEGRRQQQQTKTKTGEEKHDFPQSIPSIYAKPPDPFPLVTSFVESSSARYHLDLVHISTNPGSDPKNKSHSSPPPPSSIQAGQIPAQPTPPSNTPHTDTNTSKTNTETNDTTRSSEQQQPQPLPQPENVVTFRDAFALYLDQHHTTCRAIFVGTRRTDPHGASLSHFQTTDGVWPRFMRIHPVLDWGLSMVWVFLRHPTVRFGVSAEGAQGSDQVTDDISDTKSLHDVVDYCLMYDQGYTSLGGVGDTLRNPNLKDSNVEGGYKPAWTMTEDDEERLGRD